MKLIFIAFISCFLLSACSAQPSLIKEAANSSALASPSTRYVSNSVDIAFSRTNQSFTITEVPSTDYDFNLKNAALRLDSVSGSITIIRYYDSVPSDVEDKFREYSSTMTKKAINYIQNDWIPVLKEQGRDISHASNSVNTLLAFSKTPEASFSTADLTNFNATKARVVSDYHEAYVDNFITSEVYVLKAGEDVVAVIFPQQLTLEGEALLRSLELL